MKETQTTVTKDTLIGEAVSQHPEIADVFLSYGLHCVGCHVNAYETIEQGGLGHGMTGEEIAEMVAEANTYLADSDKPKGPFAATEKAIVKLKELSEEEGKQSWGLRVEVLEDCCSDQKYNLEFEEKPKERDTILDNGFKMFLDEHSSKELQGASLDYLETTSGAGFKIQKQSKHH